MTGENFETVTVEEISTVEACDSCGADLSYQCAPEIVFFLDAKLFHIW